MIFIVAKKSNIFFHVPTCLRFMLFFPYGDFNEFEEDSSEIPGKVGAVQGDVWCLGESELSSTNVRSYFFSCLDMSRGSRFDRSDLLSALFVVSRSILVSLLTTLLEA